MAYTCRDVIQRAQLEQGVIRSGGVPTGSDASDCLGMLQSLYAGMVTNGAFGRVRDVNISAPGSITTGVNQHINVTTDEAVTVTIPATVPHDYWDTWMPCRDYGWGLNVPFGADTGANVPRDKSVIAVTDQFGPGRVMYVYDGTIQRWMRIDELSLTEEAPLSARNYDGLASLLALSVVDMFGDALLSAQTVRAANQYKLALVTNYGNGEDCYG